MKDIEKDTNELGIGSVANWAFNLNLNIRVKLYDNGYQRLADLHNEFIGRIPNWQIRDAEYYKHQADNYGYTSFQAWEFIKKFGTVTGLGMNGYYSAEILIAANDFSPCLQH